MANLLLGYRNWAARGTVSGGSWQAAWPLVNLQDVVLARVARSTDASSGSTVAVVDLGEARDIRILGFVGHNLTAGATQRWRGASTQAGLTSAPGYDSGAQPVWRGGATPTTNAGEDELPVHVPAGLVVPAAVQSWRWWRLDLADGSNPAGHVELGYLMLWSAWQPSRNFDYGKSLGLETGTVGQETVGLIEHFDRRASRRTERFAIRNLPPAEAAFAQHLVRERDLDRPVFWMPDPEDTAGWLARSFLARIRVLGALENPSLRREGMVWDLREVGG